MISASDWSVIYNLWIFSYILLTEINIFLDNVCWLSSMHMCVEMHMPVYACVDARGGFQVSLALSAFVSGDRSLTEPEDSHVLLG